MTHPLRAWHMAVPLVAAAAYGLAAPGASYVLEDEQFFRIVPGEAGMGVYSQPEVGLHTLWMERAILYADGHPTWRPVIGSLWVLVRELTGSTGAPVLRSLGVLLFVVIVGGLLAGGRAARAPAGWVLALTLALSVHPNTPYTVGWIADGYDLAGAAALSLALAVVGVPEPSRTRLAVYAGLIFFLCASKEVLALSPVAGCLLHLAARRWRSAWAVGVSGAVGAAAFFAIYFWKLQGESRPATELSAEGVPAALALLYGAFFAPAWSSLVHPLPGLGHEVVVGGALVAGALVAFGVGVRRGDAALATLGAGILAALVILLPAAFGTVALHRIALRYTFVPTVALLAIWMHAGGVQARLPFRHLLGGVAVISGLLLLPRTVENLRAQASTLAVWRLDHQREPTASAQISYGRQLVQVGTGKEVRAGLELWLAGLGRPEAAGAPNVQAPLRREWYHLARAAGKRAEWDIALRAVEGYDARSDELAAPPAGEARLRCIQAEALNFAGRPVPAAVTTQCESGGGEAP